MQITFYGTRGSAAISGPNNKKYGGNTTCLRVHSLSLPDGHWMANDAGTGIMPLSWDFADAKSKELTLLQTHCHHDHTLGLLTSLFPYLPNFRMNIYGPIEHNIGVREVYKQLFNPPLFPVDFDTISNNLICHNLKTPDSFVIVAHPQGGIKKLRISEYQRLISQNKQLPFKDGQKFNSGQCLVITMHKGNHPERTISYRFTDNISGKSFVLLTDHENQDGIPDTLIKHIKGVDLLIIDCQYSDDQYRNLTRGWGHSSPSYVAKLVETTGVKNVALTHHDPRSNDNMIDKILADTRNLLKGLKVNVFAAYDYQVVNL